MTWTGTAASGALPRALVIAAFVVFSLTTLPVRMLDAQRPRRVPIAEPLRAVSIQPLEYGELLPGIARRIPYTDPGRAGIFEIRGPNGASIRADLVLPAALIGVASGTTLPVSWQGGDGIATASRGVFSGLIFDPRNPVITSLSPTGHLFLHLGGTATPHLPQNTDLYRATITLIIADLGS